MKNVLSLLAIILMLVGAGCSDNNNPPKFRMRNDRVTQASAQIKTSGGNTININNVAPGTSSAYQTVAEGQIDITVTIKDEPGSYPAGFVAKTDASYTIVVVNSTPPAIEVVNP